HTDELVVVGPLRTTAVAGVCFTIEASPGGGPVPAVAAGLAEVPDADVAVVLAVDLPLLSPEDVATLLPGLDDETVDAGAAADQPSWCLIRQAQGDLGAVGPQLAQAPATPLVDAGHARPRHVSGSVELDDFDEAPDLGRPHGHAHVDARAIPHRWAVLHVPPGEPGHEQGVLLGVGGRVPHRPAGRI